MTNEFDADVVHQYEHETWSRCADAYLDGFAGLTRETLPLLIETAAVGNGGRVLEIGSGPGHIAEALTQAGGVVTGIDFSDSMIEVARRRYPHITFKEANAEQLPFDTDTFDAVVSNFVVHHLARPEVGLRRFAVSCSPADALRSRSLRPRRPRAASAHSLEPSKLIIRWTSCPTARCSASPT